jgi:hypothetical protein
MSGGFVAKDTARVVIKSHGDRGVVVIDVSRQRAWSRPPVDVGCDVPLWSDGKPPDALMGTEADIEAASVRLDAAADVRTLSVHREVGLRADRELTEVDVASRDARAAADRRGDVRFGRW